MIKVLVIDDSAWNRQTLTSILEAVPGVRVVARASDGDEGLKQVFAHGPDVITLDLEMPRMDGFTFLRILMARRPTPVLVISSHAHRENVFRALELGALDFLAKPTRRGAHELATIGSELVAKVRLLARLRAVPLGARGPMPVTPPVGVPAAVAPPPPPLRRLVVIGASTGGPAALTALLGELPASLPMGIVIAQHMPARFTAAFAERLARLSRLEVREAESGDLVRSGLALVAPGAAITTVEADGGPLRVRVEPAAADARFVPSIGALFESAAAALGSATIGVILTGMAGEGERAARAVAERGGVVLAESSETAVMQGMPEEAVRCGAVTEVVPLGLMAAAIVKRV
jgi:two-component system chemotaxis response regulator CheB